MQNKIYAFFKFSLFLLILQSVFAWFLWGPITAVFLNYLPIVTAFLFYFTSKGIFRKEIFRFTKSNTICIILFFLIQIYVISEIKASSLTLTFARIIVISIVLSLNDQIKSDLFHFFTKAFAILFSISLFWWILFLLGIQLPKTMIENKVDHYHNYYLFIKQESLNLYELIFPRFQSVFLEPGYLGMISVFLFVANQFELKKKTVLIILLTILFSFSLAAYIVLIVTSGMLLILKSKRPIRNIAIMFIFILSIYAIASNINNGDNVFYNYMFKRLEFSDGKLAGNNRFSSDLSIYFEKFMNTSDKYFGLGEKKYRSMTWEAGNAGYKVFILQYGIVGTILVFLFYFSMVLSNKSKMAWILFTTYILLFLQAAYPLLECELLIFITAIPTLKSIKVNAVPT